MNHFGGTWTADKIEILVEYAKAYLQIMKKHHYWSLLYFDGFAGSGLINHTDGTTDNQVTIGAAKRIVEIHATNSFDHFYFVEQNRNKAQLLQTETKDIYPNKHISVVTDDCNKKLSDMASWLRSSNGKNWKILAYLDPCGMQLEWSSIEALKELPVDIWILVPTGMGVNRLLKKDGAIEDAWLRKLNVFLGLSDNEIMDYFYQLETQETLFGEMSSTRKRDNAIAASARLYETRLRTVFKHISKPFVLKNSFGGVMYHFLMASNNATAVKIADDIIRKYNKNRSNNNA